MTAETAIINALVLPDPGQGTAAAAVAVAGGRVLAAGSTAEIRSLCGPETHIVDAEGGTVLPGFVESHMHLFLGAFSLKVLNLVDVTGSADLRRAVQAFAAASPDAPLLFAQGFAYGALEGGAGPPCAGCDLPAPAAVAAVF